MRERKTEIVGKGSRTVEIEPSVFCYLPEAMAKEWLVLIRNNYRILIAIIYRCVGRSPSFSCEGYLK